MLENLTKSEKMPTMNAFCMDLYSECKIYLQGKIKAFYFVNYNLYILHVQVKQNEADESETEVEVTVTPRGKAIEKNIAEGSQIRIRPGRKLKV